MGTDRAGDRHQDQLTARQEDNNVKIARSIIAGLSLLALAGASAAASDYPTKPVRVIVPYSAGGANDLLARVFSESVGEALGGQFVVENRTGGAGIIGSQSVARSQPDGYTLLASGMPSLVLAPAMSPNAGFDAMKDFTHVAYLGGPPNVLVVHPSLGIKTYGEFLALARKQTDGVQYVSPSLGSVGNLVAEYLAEKEGVKLMHVAYRGGGSAIVDLLAGHVKVGCMTFSTTREHIEAGKLIPLAVSTDARLPEFPNLPTLKELGVPELVTATWYTVSGPAGMPKDVVAKLNQAINQSISRPQVQRVVKQESLQTKAMTPDEVTAFMQSEINKWTPIAKKLAAGAAR